MGNVNKMKEKWANKEAKVWFMEAQKWTISSAANIETSNEISKRKGT
jgi:hypothetical protein